MEYKDLDRRELLILSIFTLFIILLGIFPNGLLFGLENEIYEFLNLGVIFDSANLSLGKESFWLERTLIELSQRL
jgi:hypothetical protein